MIRRDLAWSGKMPLYPNVMVPLQIDLAIGHRRYLTCTVPNPARCGVWRRLDVQPPSRLTTLCLIELDPDELADEC